MRKNEAYQSGQVLIM